MCCICAWHFFEVPKNGNNEHCGLLVMVNAADKGAYNAAFNPAKVAARSARSARSARAGGVGGVGGGGVGGVGGGGGGGGGSTGKRGRGDESEADEEDDDGIPPPVRQRTGERRHV